LTGVVVRRVSSESVVVRRVAQVESVPSVVVRRVPGEGVVGRAGYVEAILKSRNVAVLDRDSFDIGEIDADADAATSYSVPGAVEGYAAGAYDEPVT